jgi:hypothetical protein
MGKNSKKQIPLWAQTGHRKPVTRREFLSSGLIPFTGWALGPSLGSLLLPHRAFGAGANCEVDPSKRMIPLITVNLQGGPNIAAEFAMKKVNGSYLPSYTLLGNGSGPGTSFNIEQDFGNVEFAGNTIGGNVQGPVSRLLVGLRSPQAANQNNALGNILIPIVWIFQGWLCKWECKAQNCPIWGRSLEARRESVSNLRWCHRRLLSM